jgi:hypothetical protein
LQQASRAEQVKLGEAYWQVLPLQQGSIVAHPSAPQSHCSPDSTRPLPQSGPPKTAPGSSSRHGKPPSRPTIASATLQLEKRVGWLGQLVQLTVDIRKPEEGQLLFTPSCSMPRLWPSSCAVVAASRALLKVAWMMLPLEVVVHMPPTGASPTVELSKSSALIRIRWSASTPVPSSQARNWLSRSLDETPPPGAVAGLNGLVPVRLNCPTSAGRTTWVKSLPR